MFSRPVAAHTWDVQSMPTNSSRFPTRHLMSVANNPKGRWTRDRIVRFATPVIALPPKKVSFDPTDPLTFFVKGAGYRPYK